MRKIIASLLRGSNVKRVSPAGGKQAEPGQGEPEAPSATPAAPAAPAALQPPRSEPEQDLHPGGQVALPLEDAADGADAADAAMWKRRSGAWRWAVDLLIYAVVLGLLAAVEYGYMPSPRTGFYCNDPKINFKFNGDTITIHILLSGSFLGPLLLLWLVEAGLARAHRGAGLGQCLRLAVRPAARWYREFVLGLGVVMFVTDAMKLLVSEPRPHFLDTCQPDAARNCSSASQWIDDFSCTNQRDTPWAVRDSMRSFPSGHTSISVYTALFLMIFLRRRMLPDVTLLLVPWLQGLCLLWALACSLTRITDHRHHWWDVLAGSLVGVVSAVYTVRMFCDDFCPRHEEDSDDSLSSGPGLGRSGKGLGPLGPLGAHGAHARPLLAGHGHGHGLAGGKDCACPCPDLDRDPDSVPARRLLSTSSSCASSLTAEERELREVSTTS